VSANGGWLFGEQGMQRSASDPAAVSSQGAQPPNCWTQSWMMTAV
jgi:hypothetical protein